MGLHQKKRLHAGRHQRHEIQIDNIKKAITKYYIDRVVSPSGLASRRIEAPSIDLQTLPMDKAHG